MDLGVQTFGLASTKVEHAEGPLRDCIWPVWGSNKENIYINIRDVIPSNGRSNGKKRSTKWKLGLHSGLWGLGAPTLDAQTVILKVQAGCPGFCKMFGINRAEAGIAMS